MPSSPIPVPDDATRRLVVVLGTAAAVLFVTTVVLAISNFWPSVFSLGSARNGDDEIESVASRFSRNLVNFDYRTLDADLDRMLVDTTGNFRREIDKVLGSDVKVFREAFSKTQAHSTGKLLGISEPTVDDGSATVLAFVSQTTRNNRRSTPQGQFHLFELTFVRTDGGWKVDNVSKVASDT